MDAEIEFLRDQVHRLNSALSQYQQGQHAQSTSSQIEEARQAESPAPWISDRSIMAPLIAEYDRHMDEMTEQLQRYQMQMADLKVKLERVVKENERLHVELRESVEKQLHTLPVASGVEGSALEEEGVIKNLQEQVQLSEQERVQAMELWQTAAQELDRLQQVYQKTISDGQIHDAQRLQLKDQLVQFQQHSHKLQVANQKLESTNQQFLKTVTEQSTEMEDLHRQLRQAKTELRTAAAKVDEMTKLLQNVQEQMHRQEEDLTEAKDREDAADRRLQQLQAALSQLEARLKVTSQEAESFRREQTVWETKLGELQARCTTLEDEKYEALAKVRESVQVAEEAALQKDQALLREKQKIEELEKTKEAIKQLIQDAAIRTRKEVGSFTWLSEQDLVGCLLSLQKLTVKLYDTNDRMVENVRKQCNVQIHRMAEELSALQLECADKESQIERSLRERKAVEEELEKVYKEGRAEPEFRKIDALHQRCLNAERMKDDMSLTLQNTQKKLKKMDMDYSEELSRCQEEVQRLQGSLAAARDDCVSVSEERLHLQQENLQLRREMDELRKATLLAQKKAKQQLSQMEQEYSLKEQGLDARVKELEESSRSTSVDLTRLLTAQQKSTQRWKEEAKNLVQAFETKITGLKAELNRQKQRSQELEMQLETDHNAIAEYERQLAENQEKTSRLQKRLTQAEQRATTATQQVCGWMRKRRGGVSVRKSQSCVCAGAETVLPRTVSIHAMEDLRGPQGTSIPCHCGQGNTTILPRPPVHVKDPQAVLKRRVARKQPSLNHLQMRERMYFPGWYIPPSPPEETEQPQPHRRCAKLPVRLPPLQSTVQSTVKILSDLEKFQDLVKKLTLSACDNLLVEIQPSCRETDQQSSVTAKMKKAKYCSRLICFIRFVDYVVVTTLHSLLVNAVTKLLAMLQEQVRQTPSHAIIERWNKNSETVTHPPDQEMDRKSPNVQPLFTTEVILETNTLTYKPSEENFQNLNDTFENGPTVEFIIETDGHLQSIIQNIKESLRSAFDAAKVYSHTFERFRLLYKENESLDLDEMRQQDHDLSFFGKALELYHNEHKEVLAIQQKRNLGLLLVEKTKLKEKLLSSPLGCLEVINEMLTQLAKKKLDAIIDEACDAQFKLEFKPATTTELANSLIFLDEIQKRITVLEQEQEIVCQMYSLINMYSVPVPPEDLAVFATLQPCISSLQDILDDAVAKRDSTMNVFCTSLNKDKKELDHQVREVLGKMKSQYPQILDISADPSQVRLLLGELQISIDEMQAKASTHTSYQKKFKMEVTTFHLLEALSAEFRLMQLLWDSLDEWDSLQDGWGQSTLHQLDLDHLSSQVTKYNKYVSQLEKGLPRNNVVPSLKAKVEVLRQRLPVVTDLCNPCMKPAHWKTIESIVGTALDTGELTVAALEEFNIFSHGTKIQEVSGQASGEASVETIITKVEETWKTTDFTVLSHGDSKEVFILGGTDDIQVLLDDSLINVGMVASSRYVAPIKFRVDKLLKQLTLFNQTLDEWLTCQRSWLYLEGIFVAPDIKRQLPAESMMFLEVDKSWKKIMAKVNKMPNALKAATQPDLLETFQHSNVLLDKIQKCLENYLESKRVIFPRFYFLSNDELLKILAQTRNPQAVQPHLRKCFDAITQLEFALLPKQPSLESGKVLDGGEQETIYSKDILYMVSPEGEKVVLTISQLMWCRDMDACLEGDHDHFAALQKFELTNFDRLNALAALVRGQLPTLHRNIITALITIDVHARDIVTDLVRQKDRCYLCLMGALQLDLGGAPAGPAGTGKTETTKDLAKAVAIQCVVFNCSDGLDYKMMGRFFSGLAQSGAWCCFDEFNRIDIEVLSVIAQQLITIRNAKAAKVFQFEGLEIKLVMTCAAFITMNPGYAGRTELPDNLKALFRPIAMMVPNYALIAEVILYSEGFESSKTLARKMTQMYKLCSEQLSQQDHYDFGMRAVKSVLVMAGSLKRENPHLSEDVVLIRALRDSNLPKFLTDDAVLFGGILSDLFPGVCIPEHDYGVLHSTILESLMKRNLQPLDSMTKKVIQLYETMLVRHGVMLVGPTGGGKTTVYTILADTLECLHRTGHKANNPFYQPVKTYVLNPKSVTMGELYGEVNNLTLEWRDGLMALSVRDAVNDTSDIHKWVICDGPVDALWIENMNTVLDDNKMLCLANSERIKLTPSIHMVFEVQDLAVASPATVSRCGMVYIDPDELKWMPFVQTWATGLGAKLPDPVRKYLLEMFEYYVERGLQFVMNHCTQVIHQVDISKVTTLCFLMEALLLGEGGPELKMDSKQLNQVLCQTFIFCYLWAVGGNLTGSHQEAFETFVREQVENNNTKLPKCDTLWDMYMNFNHKRLASWETIIPSFKYSKEQPFFEILVPTTDTVRYGYLMEKLLSVQRSVLFTGDTGVGKSVVARGLLNSIQAKAGYLPVYITFSAQTSSACIQEIIESKLEKKRKNILGAPGNKKLVVFVDDLNMPKLDSYGSQPPIELLRQFQDFSGFYDRAKFFWKKIQ
ncbi:hypothetical protein INR49_015972, partial [Caranx melampygus]